MPTPNEKYVKENTCTSHKRYESMVMYALHYALQNVLLESQYPVTGPNQTNYYIDGYFPEIKLAIEIDEEHHQNIQEADKDRQKNIENALGCEFVRVDVLNGSIYDQVDEIVCLVNEKLEKANIGPWEHEEREIFTGEYTEKCIQGLKESGAYDFVKSFRETCQVKGLDVQDCNIPGHLPEGNGYLGFLINFGDSLQLSVPITKSKKPKLLVTKFRDQSLLTHLGLHLSTPRNNGVYYVILDFEGQNTAEDVLIYLLALKSKFENFQLK